MPFMYKASVTVNNFHLMYCLGNTTNAVEIYLVNLRGKHHDCFDIACVSILDSIVFLLQVKRYISDCTCSLFCYYICSHVLL